MVVWSCFPEIQDVSFLTVENSPLYHFCVLVFWWNVSQNIPQPNVILERELPHILWVEVLFGHNFQLKSFFNQEPDKHLHGNHSVMEVYPLVNAVSIEQKSFH